MEAGGTFGDKNASIRGWEATAVVADRTGESWWRPGIGDEVGRGRLVVARAGGSRGIMGLRLACGLAGKGRTPMTDELDSGLEDLRRTWFLDVVGRIKDGLVCADSGRDLSIAFT